METTPTFILASKSPRRKQLLEEAGYSFEVKTIDFEEVVNSQFSPIRIAKQLAIDKNKAHREAFSDEVILTADTIVVFNDIVIGKPSNLGEAKKTLKLLSGKIHQVVTGICISSVDKTISNSIVTDVKFREISEKEISHYLNIQPPLDKAGSYGIQDWLGLVAIEWVKGCYRNVIGLPVSNVYEAFAQNFNIFPKKLN